MTPSILRRAAIAVGSVAAVVSLGLSCGGDGAAGVTSTDVLVGGPLAEPVDGGESVSGATVALHAPESWGLVMLGNSGDGVAIIDQVTVLGAGPDDGLELLGMYANPLPDPDGIIGATSGFDSDAGQDVVGLRVPPSKTATHQIVFGLQARRPGKHQTKGVRIAYHVGDAHYSTTLTDEALRLCAPESFEDCSAGSMVDR